MPADPKLAGEAGERQPTRLPPELTAIYAAFGCPAELHAVFLQHRTDPGGINHCVSVMIPEARDQGVLGKAMAQARARKSRVMFLCDTAGQAEEMVRFALTALPRHRRVALDRAAQGGWGTH